MQREGMHKRLVLVGSLGWFGPVLQGVMYRRIWGSSLRPSEAVTPNLLHQVIVFLLLLAFVLFQHTLLPWTDLGSGIA
jgi:hypothetical protein